MGFAAVKSNTRCQTQVDKGKGAFKTLSNIYDAAFLRK